MARSPNAAQIGASGVLLIQYRLLKCGIESAPMTTDDGIDLVVYSPTLEKASTVQVKTCLQPKPAGGTGHPSLDWWLPHASPAELIGLVNLANDQAWLFRRSQFEAKAQQPRDKTKPKPRHLYFYVEPDYRARAGCHESDYAAFLIERQIMGLFGIPSISN